MRTCMKTTGWLTAVAAFALAALPVHADDAEVPYRQLMATSKANAVVGSFDEVSFAIAVAAYPASETGEVMPVRPGRYLMWKLVQLFPSDRRVDRIRLTSFQEGCTPHRGDFSTTVKCKLDIRVVVEQNGGLHPVDATAEHTARYIRPEPGKDPAVIYSIVTTPIDAAVKQIAREWRRIGIIKAP